MKNSVLKDILVVAAFSAVSYIVMRNYQKKRARIGKSRICSLPIVLITCLPASLPVNIFCVATVSDREFCYLCIFSIKIVETVFMLTLKVINENREEVIRKLAKKKIRR